MDGSKVKILSLDGGGAKGFYTLGVLREVEAMMGGGPLSDHFRLIFGTSTGCIIAALLALGYKVNDIYELYRDNVPLVTKAKTRGQKSQALATLADQVFGDQKFDALKDWHRHRRHEVDDRAADDLQGQRRSSPRPHSHLRARLRLHHWRRRSGLLLGLPVFQPEDRRYRRWRQGRTRRRRLLRQQSRRSTPSPMPSWPLAVPPREICAFSASVSASYPTPAPPILSTNALGQVPAERRASCRRR